MAAANRHQRVFISLDPATGSSALTAFTRGDPQIVMAYSRQQQQSTGGLRFITEFLRWDGVAWVPVGEPGFFLNRSLSPALTAGGNPAFAAEYSPLGGPQILVQQFVP